MTSFSKRDVLRGFFILKCSLLIHLFLSRCSALYLSMKDTEKGIKELNLEKDKKIFNHCFTGKRSCKSEMGQLGKAIWSSRRMCVVGGCGAWWVDGVIEGRPVSTRIELPQCGNRKKDRKEFCYWRYSFGNSSYINQRVIFLPNKWHHVKNRYRLE